MALAATYEPRAYRAFGLRIHSDIDLPLQREALGEPDVRIRLVPSSTRELQESTGTAVFEFDTCVQRLWWPLAGRFVIRGAGQIDVEAAKGADACLLQLPLLGPVMAMLLHLRGMLVLHASAVSLGGGGVVFLGDKQAGKSTIAAALLAGGHSLVTDDVLALEFPSGGRPQALPSFPQLKVDPEAAENVFGAPRSSLPLVFPGSEKRRLSVSQQFCTGSTSARHIYLLEQGAVAATEPVSPPDAFASLIRFSYVGRFGPAAFVGATAEAHFGQCAALAGAIPFSRIIVPRDFARLTDVIRLIETDCI